MMKRACFDSGALHAVFPGGPVLVRGLCCSRAQTSPQRAGALSRAQMVTGRVGMELVSGLEMQALCSLWLQTRLPHLQHMQNT